MQFRVNVVADPQINTLTNRQDRLQHTALLCIPHSVNIKDRQGRRGKDYSISNTLLYECTTQ